MLYSPFLAKQAVPTYVHCHVSWKLLQGAGAISPLWISYEDELLCDKVKLASRICEWLWRSGKDHDRLSASRPSDKGLEGMHVNKGVAGRDVAVQGGNRQRVIDSFSDFKDLADWSEILD